jgi:hypothetical protein
MLPLPALPWQAPYPDAAARLVASRAASSRHLRKLAVRLMHITAPAAPAPAPRGSGGEEGAEERYPAIASLERLLAATRTLFFPTSSNAQRMTQVRGRRRRRRDPQAACSKNAPSPPLPPAQWLAGLTDEFTHRIARQTAAAQAAALLGAEGVAAAPAVAEIPPAVAARFVRAVLPLIVLGLYYPGRSFDCNQTGTALQVCSWDGSSNVLAAECRELCHDLAFRAPYPHVLSQELARIAPVAVCDAVASFAAMAFDPASVNSSHLTPNAAAALALLVRTLVWPVPYLAPHLPGLLVRGSW